MSKQINLIINDKGGVGKSFFVKETQKTRHFPQITESTVRVRR